MAKKSIIIAVIVLLVLAAVYFFSVSRTEESEELPLEEKITGQTEINPVENLPETNPFKAETNPFSDGYKNPFE